jgi:hypothetical protein
MALKDFSLGKKSIYKKMVLIKWPQLYVYHIVDCLISIAEFAVFN